ncbi:bifunctional adenosylcobinamide kinase/adenosylcobinamide-phosphate guanylyltransferase [Algiphilus sp.]|uniref:bifunctional adenosylcobinamide kinase/adenosylcobinamide-phosphate guanylyltransferase n=1 Tax=Algiphilus sp. TaxID=1872431 RepID=UPI003C58A021
MRIGHKSGADLFLSAAAKLSLIDGVTRFSRNQLHHEAKSAREIYKRSTHGNNASAYIRSLRDSGRLVLVDCLTLWLTRVLCSDDADALLAAERAALIEAVRDSAGPLLMVSNETGLGIMPMDALSRRFGDEAGRLHQALAALCERVVLTAAGLPLVLKGDAIEATP